MIDFLSYKRYSFFILIKEKKHETNQAHFNAFHFGFY